MQSRLLGFVTMMSTALTACATFEPPQIGYDDEQAAVPQSDPLSRWSKSPSRCPLPGQLKPAPARRLSRAISASASISPTPPPG
jgi:hypothetical protein